MSILAFSNGYMVFLSKESFVVSKQSVVLMIRTPSTCEETRDRISSEEPL